MSTQTEAVKELLESLDFEPACTYGHPDPHPWRWGGRMVSPCQLPAAWVLVISCCGAARLLCDGHLSAISESDALWICANCNNVWPYGASLSERFSRIERIR